VASPLWHILPLVAVVNLWLQGSIWNIFQGRVEQRLKIIKQAVQDDLRHVSEHTSQMSV
jgi:hypothetical protein